MARFWVDQASAGPASHRVSNEEKLRPLRHVAGFSWNKKIARAVGSGRIPAIMQGVSALKMRFRQPWFAPPELSIEDPRKCWELVAAAGLDAGLPVRPGISFSRN